MLQNELKDMIDKYDADIAILVKNLNNNKIVYNYNEKNIYPSGGIIKIPIMIEALIKAYDLEIPLLSKIEIKDSDKVDCSAITEQNLTECTYLDLITCMIINSDNTAANVLINLLGINKINETIKSLNMKNTSLQRKMIDFEVLKENNDNFTTLEDMLIIMEKLYRWEIVNKEISKKAMDILKKQRDNSMLKRYIFDNVILANKTGKLHHLNNDIGIFHTKSADYFIGIFVNNVNSNREGCEIIGNISRRVYNSFIENSISIR